MKSKQTYPVTLAFIMIAMLATTACNSSRDALLRTDTGSVELRQIQSRAYDTTDKEMMLRTVLSALQDLGFVIDKADDVIGSVSATKLDRYALRMTVSVRPRGETQLLVRANAQYNLIAVNDPEPYQNFFNTLSKALFLEAHHVE